MNPAKVGKLGSGTQITWVNWVPEPNQVLEPSEPSSKGFVALATNSQGKPKVKIASQLTEDIFTLLGYPSPI